MLEFRVAGANHVIADELRVSVGSRVILLTCLRFLEDLPQVYAMTYLNFERCAPILNEDLSNASLYRLLRQKLGLVMVKGVRTIRATSLSTHQAKLLGGAQRSAALQLSSIGFLADGTPLEYFVSSHRGDISGFEVQVIR